MLPSVEELWNEYRLKVFSFVKSRVGDYDVAEDITQDVFVKILKTSAPLHAKDKGQSWLYQIARNAIIDYGRAKKPLAELPDLAQAPEDSTTKALKELAECLTPMINRLPAPYKESLTLSDLEGRSHRFISQTLGLSLSGSKSRVQRGRLKLKELLIECCRVEFDSTGQVSDYELRTKACNVCN